MRFSHGPQHHDTRDITTILTRTKASLKLVESIIRQGCKRELDESSSQIPSIQPRDSITLQLEDLKKTTPGVRFCYELRPGRFSSLFRKRNRITMSCPYANEDAESLPTWSALKPVLSPNLRMFTNPKLSAKRSISHSSVSHFLEIVRKRKLTSSFLNHRHCQHDGTSPS